MKRLAKELTVQEFINDFINNEIEFCNSKVNYPNVILKVDTFAINDYLNKKNSIQLYAGSCSFDFDVIVTRIDKEITKFNKTYNKSYYIRYFRQGDVTLILEFNA